MIPILYESTETNFTSNGLGRLPDATECIVTEERNGAYELRMMYPIDGLHFSDIQISRFIYAVPADGKGKQPFRIYSISKPLDGIVEIMNSLEATTEVLECLTEIEAKVLDGDVDLKTKKLWYQGVEKTYYEFLTTYTEVEDIPETGTVNAKSTDFLAALETEMDSKNSFSQQTMIQLQSQTTKRDQAYDMISNTLKSLNNVLVGNANNM